MSDFARRGQFRRNNLMISETASVQVRASRGFITCFYLLVTFYSLLQMLYNVIGNIIQFNERFVLLAA